MVSIPFPDLLDVAGLADINVINAVEPDWLYQAIDIQVVSKVGKHYCNKIGSTRPLTSKWSAM